MELLLSWTFKLQYFSKPTKGPCLICWEERNNITFVIWQCLDSSCHLLSKREEHKTLAITGRLQESFDRSGT